MILAAVPAGLLRRWPLERAHHVNVALSSAVVLLALGGFGGEGVPFGRCLSLRLLHVPCPFCGIMRSVGLAARLDFAGAWALHPAGILVAAVLALQIVVRPIAVRFARRLPMRRVLAVEATVNTVVVASCFAAWLLR